ncbi:MAG TPA: hypothetical protein VFS43_18615 [Polyangiaceae bacterium]|nr:hypothetical protein [Polyangiaceae bacterium]
MSAMLPYERDELRRFFSSHSGATLGLHSSLGPQLERALNTKPPAGSPRGSRKVSSKATRSPSYPDLADRLGSDTVDWLRIDRRLTQAGSHPKRAGLTARRVLEAYLAPDDSPEPVLPLYQGLGRVMLLTRASGDATAAVLRRADEAGRKGDREAAAWLAEIRIEAEGLVAWAEDAYARARPRPQTRAEMAGELGKVLEDAARDADRDKGVFRGPRPKAPALPGRTDGQGRVVFSTPSAKAAGGRR